MEHVAVSTFSDNATIPLALATGLSTSAVDREPGRSDPQAAPQPALAVTRALEGIHRNRLQGKALRATATLQSKSRKLRGDYRCAIWPELQTDGGTKRVLVTRDTEIVC